MDLNNLDSRLSAVEARLNTLEKQLNIPPEAVSPWDSPTATPAKEKKIAKTPKSGNWLGIIAVICFIFAAGFIIKLSIDSGWLTPERQIIIAMLFGSALIGVGLMLLTTYRSYASLLPATGIVILYLSAFAAHRFYALLSFEAALVLTTLVSLVCIWLFVKIKHDAYALTAAVGTYLAPVILGFDTTAVFSLYYFLCCSFTFALLSIWLHSRTMTVIAAYLAIFVTGLIGFNLNQDVLIALVLAAHFCIFALGAYLYTLYNKNPLSEAEAWSFFPVLTIFYAMEYYFLNRIQADLAPWLSLTFAGLLLLLYVSAQRLMAKEDMNSKPVIFTFAAIVFFHSLYLELLPQTVKPWLFVLLMAGFALMPKRSMTERDKKAYYLPVLVLLIIVVVEYFSILQNLWHGPLSSWLLVATAAFVSIWLVLLRREEEKAKYGTLLLTAAHALAIIGLYRLTKPHGSLSVSASWLCYAVLVMGFAYQRKDKVMAKSALLVLALAAGKALLYDAASTPTVVRIFCLLLTGIVLYGAGFLMKKIAEWK